MIKEIVGGVCAAKGFSAGGVHCGVKEGSDPAKKDLALILSEVECQAAAVYTTNRVKAAPIYVTMEHLEDGVCRGIIANSGNANACAPESHENALEMCTMAATATGLKAQDFLVASTGVIGQTIRLAPIQAGLPGLAKELARSADASDAAAQAIMTTDTVKKEVAVEVEIDGKTVTVGAIAKGSGMIHPNMGTMLCFITTDCAITHEMLQDALHEIVPRTFNRVTVDGDTSTNDMCVVLANGLAGNEQIEWKDEDYTAFAAALRAVCETLARAIAADGEGASRLVTCIVHHARSEESAERLAKAVVGSALVKAAMFAPTPTGDGFYAPWAIPRLPSVLSMWISASPPPPGRWRCARRVQGWPLTKTWPKRCSPKRRSLLTCASMRVRKWPPAGAATSLTIT